MDTCTDIHNIIDTKTGIIYKETEIEGEEDVLYPTENGYLRRFHFKRYRKFSNEEVPYGWKNSKSTSKSCVNYMGILTVDKYSNKLNLHYSIIVTAGDYERPQRIKNLRRNPSSAGSVNVYMKATKDIQIDTLDEALKLYYDLFIRFVRKCPVIVSSVSNRTVTEKRITQEKYLELESKLPEHSFTLLKEFLR